MWCAIEDAPVCDAGSLVMRAQVTEGGFERVSGITDVEQVSYVGSPYLPRCIRTQWGKEMTSNKHRSSESARGANTIKDDLSEAITLRCQPQCPASDIQKL